MKLPVTNGPRRVRGLMSFFLVAALSGGGLAARATDVLEKPSLISQRSLSLVQLGLGRAGNRLVSVGERGNILLSDDHGRTWRQVPSPVSVSLTRVAFADPETGWAVGHGGVVLRSSDRGETWIKQLDGVRAAQLEIEAARTQGAGKRLTDAERLVADGPDKPLLGLRVVDAEHVQVFGAYGLLFATDDGGKTWRSQMEAVRAGDGRHLYALRQVKGALLFAGEQGTVLRADGSGYFSRQAFPGRGTLFGLLATPSGTLLAYGLKGALYRSTDNAQHWEKVEMPTASLVAGSVRHDGEIVIADESGRLYRSRDDGRGFAPLAVRQAFPLGDLIEAADGSWIGSGPGGVHRIEILENKK